MYDYSEYGCEEPQYNQLPEPLLEVTHAQFDALILGEDFYKLEHRTVYLDWGLGPGKPELYGGFGSGGNLWSARIYPGRYKALASACCRTNLGEYSKIKELALGFDSPREFFLGGQRKYYPGIGDFIEILNGNLEHTKYHDGYAVRYFWSGCHHDIVYTYPAMFEHIETCSKCGFKISHDSSG